MLEKSFHICFIAPAIYGLYNPQARAPFSDADMQIHELARFLGTHDDLDISIITGDYGQENVEYYDGVLVYRTKPAVPIPFFKRLWSEKTPFQNLVKKINADVYVCCGTSFHVAETAEYCRKHHRPFVYRVSHQRECDGSFTKNLSEEGERFGRALQQATRVICQTEAQRSLLRRTEKLDSIAIPNGVPIYMPSEIQKQEVLWIGEIVEWKQPERFFRLALTVPQQSFTIMAYPRDEEYFEKLVEKTRDIPNLAFQNNVPYHELPFFLERAKLLVNTSRFEGYPYTFSLANANGVPVASLNIDPDGVMEKHQIGICARGSEVRLAEEVTALVSLENQLKSYQKNAYEYARQTQDMEKVGMDFLKELIHCSGEM